MSQVLFVLMLLSPIIIFATEQSGSISISKLIVKLDDSRLIYIYFDFSFFVWKQSKLNVTYITFQH